METGFSINSSKGFHIKFSNGLTLSTQFGGGNYCNNYDEIEIGSECSLGFLSCKNAEIAIWETEDRDSGWKTAEILSSAGIECNDDVHGHVDINDWLKIVDACRKWKEKINEGKAS